VFLISSSAAPPSPPTLPCLPEILGIDDIFAIFEIFVEISEDYQHIIRFPSVEMFDIFEILGAAQEFWGLWDISRSAVQRERSS
jgi:hypothetical protein